MKYVFTGIGRCVEGEEALSAVSVAAVGLNGQKRVPQADRAVVLSGSYPSCQSINKILNQINFFVNVC